MPQISLTDFVDLVSKSGRPKATKVIQLKERPEYEPAFDFYKPLREWIVSTHQANGNKQQLDVLLTRVFDTKKLTNYPELIGGYKKWWGRKSITWFDPSRTNYSSSGCDILINPELGLEVNGQAHVIKLYFKSDALSSFQAEIITGLMEHTLRTEHNKVTFAVLDVRNSKLFVNAPGHRPHMPMVDAELAYIASIWST